MNYKIFNIWKPGVYLPNNHLNSKTISSVKDFLKKNELWTMEIVYMEFERICNTKHLLSCLSNIKAKLTSYENSQQILHVKLN